MLGETLGESPRAQGEQIRKPNDQGQRVHRHLQIARDLGSSPASGSSTHWIVIQLQPFIPLFMALELVTLEMQCLLGNLGNQTKPFFCPTDKWYLIEPNLVSSSHSDLAPLRNVTRNDQQRYPPGGGGRRRGPPYLRDSQRRRFKKTGTLCIMPQRRN